MAQFARPSADLDNTGVWTTEPLWSKIVSEDGTFAVSDSNPTSAEPFTVSLTSVTDPGVSTGHVIRAHWSKQSGAGTNEAGRAQLREGFVSEAAPGTLIATLTGDALANVLTTQGYTLTGPETDAITDYPNLALRVFAEKTGGGPGDNWHIEWVEFEVPDASTTSEGSVSGSIGWAGSVTGTTDRSGAVSGSVGWAGSVTGEMSPAGSVSGAVSWIGAVTGEAPLVQQDGEVNGSISWVGSVTGTTDRSGDVSGSITWAGTVSGATDHEGSASGAIGWVGSVTGSSTHEGTADGSISWVGSVTGEAPAVGQQGGSVNGSIAWVGSVTGQSSHEGSVGGSLAWVGSVAGESPAEGTVTGSIEWVGTVNGPVSRLRLEGSNLAGPGVEGFPSDVGLEGTKL